jgi:hypothetical protein
LSIVVDEQGSRLSVGTVSASTWSQTSQFLEP